MGFLDDDDDDGAKKAGRAFFLALVIMSCALIGTSVQRLESNGTPNRTTPTLTAVVANLTAREPSPTLERPRSLTTPP